jgi:hypothetical protein
VTRLPKTRRPAGASFPRALTLAATTALLTGCADLGGPAIVLVAPRIAGRVIDDTTGLPVRNAMAGGRLWRWRQPTGGFARAAEETLLREDFARTDADGRFVLPERRVVLPFTYRDPGPRLRLAVTHGAYASWNTNFPVKALADDPRVPRIDAGDLRLTPRRTRG